MAIAIVGRVIAINFVPALVLLVSLAAGSFVGTYLIGQVLPLADARQAHEMLERLRPLPAGKVVLNAPGDS